MPREPLIVKITGNVITDRVDELLTADPIRHSSSLDDGTLDWFHSSATA